ncbi:MAG: hypothetical protein IPM39_28695 [Chloroflexi bacterium]|nr:hypothetical protein [Chloroflexota bacterium]
MKWSAAVVCPWYHINLKRFGWGGWDVLNLLPISLALAFVCSRLHCSRPAKRPDCGEGLGF